MTFSASETPRYTTILFDLDHTLLDSDTSEALAFSLAMATVGRDSSAEDLATYKAINSKLWHQVELGSMSPNTVKVERFARLFEALDVDADPEVLGTNYLEALGENGELYAGARTMLEELTKHADLALITNGIGSVQRRRIERLGIDSFFRAVAISGELGVSKPNPEIFLHLFDALGGVDLTSTLIVGDSLSSDITGGIRAGINTCWYCPGSTPPGGVNPTHTVGSLEEITAHFAKFP